MRATAGGTSIVVLRKSDLVNSDLTRWSDPQGIAVAAQRNRAVLLSNPFLGEDDPVQLLGLHGDQVIGSSLVIPGRMVVEGREHPLLWCSNLYVDPAARRTMIALKIVKMLQELGPTVAVCGVSHAAHTLYKGFGWIDFVMPRHILLHHSRSVLERKIGRALSQWLRIPVDLGLQVFNWGLVRPQSREVEWDVCAEVPRELEQRLSAMPADGSNTFLPRSAESVRWQLNGCVPGTIGDCNFLVTIHVGGSLAGYAAAKVKFFPVASSQGFRNVRLGSLYDWMIFDRKRLRYRDLVACTSRELIARGADAVELCATNPEEEAALKSMRLPRVGMNHLMWRAAKGSILASERFRDRDRWAIRPGDDDLFM